MILPCHHQHNCNNNNNNCLHSDILQVLLSIFRKAQVQVHVQVLDANDNGPMISVNGSQAITEVNRQLEEEQEVGVLVFVVEVREIHLVL